MAALEAEKYLVEMESSTGESKIEDDKEVKKSKSQIDGVVPEYRSNPML